MQIYDFAMQLQPPQLLLLSHPLKGGRILKDIKSRTSLVVKPSNGLFTPWHLGPVAPVAMTGGKLP